MLLIRCSFRTAGVRGCSSVWRKDDVRLNQLSNGNSVPVREHTLRLFPKCRAELALDLDAPQRLNMSSENTTTYRSPAFLRIALGLVYFHFGMLKFFPDLSPAELIASQTIMAASLHWLDAQTALCWLAILEVGIGAALILNVLPRLTLALFLFHMAGTFLPLFLLPEFAFKIPPLALTFEGQYVLKNIVFVAAGWTVLVPHVFSRPAQPATTQ